MGRRLKEAKLHPEREIPAKQTTEDEAAERLLAQEPDLGENRGTPLGIDEDGVIVFDTELLEAAKAGREVRTFTAMGTFIGESLHGSGIAQDIDWSRKIPPTPPMIVSPSVYKQLEARGVDVSGAKKFDAARGQLEADISAKCNEVLQAQATTLEEQIRASFPAVRTDERGYSNRIIFRNTSS